MIEIVIARPKAVATQKDSAKINFGAPAYFLGCRASLRSARNDGK
jgi:hypothetical protein